MRADTCRGLRRWRGPGAPGTGANGTGMSEGEIAKFAAVTAEMGEDEVVGHYSE